MFLDLPLNVLEATWRVLGESWRFFGGVLEVLGGVLEALDRSIEAKIAFKLMQYWASGPSILGPWAQDSTNSSRFLG